MEFIMDHSIAYSLGIRGIFIPRCQRVEKSFNRPLRSVTSFPFFIFYFNLHIHGLSSFLILLIIYHINGWTCFLFYFIFLSLFLMSFVTQIIQCFSYTFIVIEKISRYFLTLFFYFSVISHIIVY